MEKEDIQLLIENAEKANNTELDLSNRDIKEIPDSIEKLTNLKKLNLSYNLITSIPKEIGKLTNLEELRINRNRIKTIPAEIGLLRKLRLIDISNNKLYTFPKEIGALENLTTLDASYCNMENLPYEFTKLTNLQELSLEGNTFIYPPQKVVKRGLYATMYFLYQDKSSKTKPRISIQVSNIPSTLKEGFSQFVQMYSNILGAYNTNVEIEIQFKNEDAPKHFSDEIIKTINNTVSAITHYQQMIISDDEHFNKNKKELLVDIKRQISQISSTLSNDLHELKNIQNILDVISGSLEDI